MPHIRRNATSHAALMVMAGLVLLALNLRPAATAVGPVLGEIRSDLGLNATNAGVLTALPALCFAAFGAMAPIFSNRVGPHRTIGMALVAMVAGQSGRLLVDAPAPFLLLSIITLGGMAVANVLLPSLVRQHFPSRIGFITALYSTALNVGTMFAGLFTAPLAMWLGGWRQSMWIWVGMTVISCVPWLFLVSADRDHEPIARHAAWGFRHIVHTRLGWLMALFFGAQSTQAYTAFGWLSSIYVDAGASPSFGGLMLGILTGLSIPFGFLVPMYVSRSERPQRALWLFGACGITSYTGLLFAPLTLPWLWAVLLSIGMSGFPYFLALLGRRANSSDGVAVLSAFSQSVGYLIAAIGPFLFGALRGLTGDFQVPIIVTMVLFLPLVGFGLAASRPRLIEDELIAGSNG